jgi:hypothetical protein
MRRFLPALFLFAATLLSAQAAPPAAPDLHVLMEGVMQRAKWQREAKLDSRYAYRQKRTTDKFDTDGNIVEHTTVLFEVTPLGERTLFRVLEKNGRPLTAEEQKKEEEKEAKLREGAKKARKGEDDGVELNAELVARYNFVYGGEELVAGRKAHVLSFSPKPGPLPEKRRMDRMLNRLRGRVWIDQATHDIAKVDMALTEPVKFFVGLGVVRSLHFVAEMFPLNAQTLMPREVAVSYDARAMFKNVRVNQRSEYSDYRPVSSTAEKR